MLSKISALALIASVQAAPTATPAGCTVNTQNKCTDFPQYKTLIPVATVAATTAGAVTLGGAGYACVRNNFAYVWPMTRGAGGIAADPTSGPVRAFYTTAVNQIGTVTATGATTATDNSGCCASAETACLASNADGQTAYTGVVVSRITPGASGDNAYAYTAFHNDFLLAATYQLSVATLGAAQSAANGWCDPQLLALTATTNQDLVSGIGLDGNKKCTYIIQGAAAMGAPAFVVKGVSAPSAFTFDLHFAEWKAADVAYLAASGATSTNFFYGNYVANTYPTPIASAAWNSNWANWKPEVPVPGSIGTVVYWSQLSGDINTARQLTVDSASLFAQYDSLNTSYAGYNNALAASNSAVGAYNTAIAAEKARVGDFFKAIFEAPVKIPARPCPPSQPGAWNGPRVWKNLTGQLTSLDGAEKTAEQAARAGAVSNSASGQYKTISGFLQVSTDSTAFTATTLATTGHAFGRAGQGTASYPGTNNAFWTGDPSVADATKAASLMVSVFPNVGASTALAAGQNITITAKSIAWNTGVFPLNAPAQPAAPAMPDAALGAKYIAAGLTAATAVAMTLF